MSKSYVRRLESVQGAREIQVVSEIAARIQELDGRKVAVYADPDACEVRLLFLLPDNTRKKLFPVCDDKGKRLFAQGEVHLVEARFSLEPPEIDLHWSARVNRYTQLEIASGRVPGAELTSRFMRPEFLLKDVDDGDLAWEDWTRRLESRLKRILPKLRRKDVAVFVAFSTDHGGQPGPRFISQGMH
jgi:hypothetical protein